MIIGSFGASAVLLFGAPSAPFSQPRNVIGGHVLSSLCGVGTTQLLADAVGVAVAGPVAVATALVVMQLTRTVHPPAGGTALIAVHGSPAIDALGWGFGVPCAVGPSVLVLSALGLHRLTGVKYPAA